MSPKIHLVAVEDSADALGADVASIGMPRARGEALQTIQEAEGYAADRVKRSEGDAARFEALYRADRRAPEVTRRRLYLETMLDLLPSVRQKVIIDDSLDGLLPLLSIDGSLVRPGTTQRQEEER